MESFLDSLHLNGYPLSFHLQTYYRLKLEPHSIEYNKQHHWKVLFGSFQLNGYDLGLNLQTYKVRTTKRG